ncbi:hypothetical protein [Shewanella sp. UCD-KL21]|uniref:hypothetical protein n=1 Tax=Shewanella sp. UCD-KL21 TaxID=1917164 RepID=UPI0009709C8E|nr:hypothetical protein [Shewanella sp. UCD-KL21]
MDVKIKLVAFSVLCLNLGGCDLIDGILHPEDDDEDSKIDKNFSSDAQQLGLSETTIKRLCNATDNISIHCVSTYNDENALELRVEYTFNDVLLKNSYAKSTNASRVIFHLPADGAIAKIEFENSRLYDFDSGYSYTWSEPADFSTANLADSSEASVLALENATTIEEVSDSELSILSSAEFTNTEYSLTEAQDIIIASKTMLFPTLDVNVTSTGITEPTDASFVMFTAGHTAILSTYSSALSTAIEQSWN